MRKFFSLSIAIIYGMVSNALVHASFMQLLPASSHTDVSHCHTTDDTSSQKKPIFDCCEITFAPITVQQPNNESFREIPALLFSHPIQINDVDIQYISFLGAVGANKAPPPASYVDLVGSVLMTC